MSFRLEILRPLCRLPGRPAPEDRLDLVVERGRRTLLLGRSGAGKSLLAKLALGRLPSAPVQTEGVVKTEGQSLDLSTWAPGSHVGALRKHRGGRLSFVPQGLSLIHI